MDVSSPLSLPRTVALVGLMGAGKSAIGKRLAARLGLPFVDADDEIERAAGCTIAEFFERFGEQEFRAGERRVISRLLEESPRVLSTGGGAYMDPETRSLMKTRALTVWLRAELEVLFDRVKKRTHRPLLRQGDPKEILARLMQQRYPIYAEADIVVDSTAQPAERTTEQVIDAIRATDVMSSPRTIRVDLAGRAYDIAIGPGLIDRAGELSRPLLAAPRVTIVSDDTVEPIYGARLA
eukprot:gene8533-10861_t